MVRNGYGGYGGRGIGGRNPNDRKRNNLGRRFKVRVARNGCGIGNYRYGDRGAGGGGYNGGRGGGGNNRRVQNLQLIRVSGRTGIARFNRPNPKSGFNWHVLENVLVIKVLFANLLSWSVKVSI